VKVILFGASGMVGQGVLRECLLDPEVESVLSIGRTKTGQTDAKLREDAMSALDAGISGYDACFFCLGVSAAGMNEAEYTKITYDLTLDVANKLVKTNPELTFIYVSGAGTDSSEKGRSMWARVKGKTENALLALPFKAKYMFRPAFIQPMHGIKSKTRLYRAIYVVSAPLYPVWNAIVPSYVTTTEKVGKAMLVAVRKGAPNPVVENKDINRLTKSDPVS
jgi:uncharacterized protein YbjT (DUF2867 family)